MFDSEYRYRRFKKTWLEAGAKTNPGPSYNQLVYLYSEPHRAYHTLKHPFEGLNDINQVAHLLDNPVAVKMAYLYHDIIYDSPALNDDNEERSAHLASTILKQAGIDYSFIQNVVCLIMATKHNIPANDNDGRFIADIDLGILASYPPKLIKYELAIRKEYSWVSQADYRVGRLVVLESFLKRPTVYQTDYFKNRWGERAKSNLNWLIKSLS